MNTRYSWGYNDNGVYGYWSHSGSMFGHEAFFRDGRRYFKTCIPLFVPEICKMYCWNYDPGEYGEAGSLLSGPYCEANVWFPTAKGTCKKIDPRDGYWLWIEARNLQYDMQVAERVKGK